MHTDVIIIGGGIAGLRLADLLHQRGHPFQLLEARDRIGGRVLSEAVGQGGYDLGPSWFWPGQPRIAEQIDRFDLTRFDQFSTGALAYEDERGQVQYGRGFASMEGSWRLQGGIGALTTALANVLPPDALRLSTPVTGLSREGQGVTVTLESGETLRARRAVIATPPRVAVHRIAFSLPLPAPTLAAMRAIPTWMAGQAKAVAVYDDPFWREAGLSGDASSRRGPMAEIHDASPADGGPYALFGFIGVPPDARQDEPALRAALVEQFGRLFGQQALQPRALLLKDWAVDPYTATDEDRRPLNSHPQYELPPVMGGLWDDTLHFGGTEVAPEFGGYLEGAFAAAEAVANRLAPATY